jgi:hypothetical protein
MTKTTPMRTRISIGNGELLESKPRTLSRALRVSCSAQPGSESTVTGETKKTRRCLAGGADSTGANYKGRRTPCTGDYSRRKRAQLVARGVHSSPCGRASLSPERVIWTTRSAVSVVAQRRERVNRLLGTPAESPHRSAHVDRALPARTPHSCKLPDVTFNRN